MPLITLPNTFREALGFFRWERRIQAERLKVRKIVLGLEWEVIC
jgi:hypothetical protein